jgi:hypothetical protein
VAVARALMNRPALLLADEPTGALDTASGADVRRLLTDLHADGQTMLLVTHDRTLAAECATRTIEVVDGRIAVRHRAGTAAMSALSRVVRSGVSRRWVQTVVITLATAAAVTSGVLGSGLLVASNAPFDHAFAAQRGAHLTVLTDPAKATTASWLPPPMPRASRRPPARSPWLRSWCSRVCHRGDGAAPGRTWPGPDRRRPDGSGDRCRPGEPDRGTLGGRARLRRCWPPAATSACGWARP